MDTTTSVVATGVVVTLGRWSQDKDIPFKIFVGFGMTAIFIAVMTSANQRFGEQFALLLLVAAVMYYAVPIAEKVGK